MHLYQTASLRQEMRQQLTPRMIQSMEILQLPLLALEQRIAQELQINPVLELKAGGDEDQPHDTEEKESDRIDRKILEVNANSGQPDDFERLSRMVEYLENEEFSTNSGSEYRHYDSGLNAEGDRDRKLDAMANTAGQEQHLNAYLLQQWSLYEVSEAIAYAGKLIINRIDQDGFMKTPLEEIVGEAHPPVDLATLQVAWRLVKTLDPPGIGARDISESLLIQLEHLQKESEGNPVPCQHDFELEKQLILLYLDDLKHNRYPQIAKRTGRGIEQIKQAVKRLGRLNPRPGRGIGPADNQPILPDARIWFDPDTRRYEVEMARDPSSEMTLSRLYQRMLKKKSTDKKTREYLGGHLRNAKWLLDALQQRRNTVSRVIREVVDAQQEFMEKGPEYLRPLPMTHVGEKLGIHVATVSRAVSAKWLQTPRGIYPLRRFFSSGTTSVEGEDMSWNAVKEKLKAIIDNEDKSNPLNDDEIVQKVAQQGITLARRTVAKYRKTLGIPTARQRKVF